MWQSTDRRDVMDRRALVTGSLQGAVVVALAWAACRWIPRVPAALQAWVWWLVALKLALRWCLCRPSRYPCCRLPISCPAADIAVEGCRRSARQRRVRARGC